ncbi:MAG: response regulator transcription factor [Croceibacterium sp.]
MTDFDRVLLALADRAVAAELRAALPHAEVITLGPAAPLPGPRPGAQWAFVDWLLPDTSGLELCRRLRSAPATASAHITLVLDDGDPESRRRALKAGADDYLPGPLTVQAVLGRVGRLGAIRPRDPHEHALAHGALELDPLAHRAWFAGRPIPLRPKQFALLAHFMGHPNRVHSRGNLLRVLGNEGHGNDERTVDVCVGRLRRDLRSVGAPDPLRTVRNRGYVFDSV